MDIKTFVFLDSETTGLPYYENNKTRMTELCLTAVQSDHLRLGTFPRIQNKINLCFNPRKLIDHEASKVTGLSNFLLEYQSEFNGTTFGVLQNFLSLFRQPVCFVAHNGNQFDYPILRAEFHKIGSELPEEVLCVDSLLAFRELHYETVEKLMKEETAQEAQENQTLVEVPLEFQDGFDELLCNIADDLENSGCSKKLTVQEVQKINETTPQKNIKNGQNGVASTSKNNTENNVQRNGNEVVKRQLTFGKPSFRLGDVYTRLTSKLPTDAHKAEYDVNMLIESAAVLGERFVDWSNLNARRFCDIPMMRPGQRIGT